MDLVASSVHLNHLHRALFALAPEEGAAFLTVQPSGGQLLLRGMHAFARDELETGPYGELTIDEHAQLRALARIKRAGAGLVEVHTHPGSREHPSFSAFDESQLPPFGRYVSNKLRGAPFGALVLGEGGYAGRALREEAWEEMRLVSVGERQAEPAWAGADRASGAPLPREFDRQTRAIGPEGQQRLARLRVGVVGLGGTGSQIVQQLAHLGVRTYVLVENDRVEWTNLPRLAGASRRDARRGRPKLAVAKRTIRRLRGREATIACPGTLRDRASFSALTNVDLIVGCVDNDGARLILTELAAAYLIPYLDLGVGIERQDGRDEVGGRVAFFLPGGPCLACADEIDFTEAAEDLESESTRAVRIRRGYAKDRRVEPALMPLNGVVVSLGMMELLAFATGLRHVVPFVRYDALEAQFVSQHVDQDPECAICQPAYAMGEHQMLERYALDEQARHHGLVAG